MTDLAEAYNEIIPVNPWKKYQLLSSWKTDSNQAASIVKSLQQLELTLNVLSEEALQVCSLLKPLSDQLMLFLPDEDDTPSISNFIRNELKSAIQDNEFLIMSCFFDPRFQNNMSPEDLSLAKSNIAKTLPNEPEELKPKQEPKSEKISSLKMFFNRGKLSQESEGPSPKVRKTNLSVELTNYTAENPLDVEFCPLDWWKENGSKYRALAKLSNKYFSVPCFYRSDIKLKLESLVDIDQKRFYLSEKYFKEIWFLHNLRK